MKYFNLTLGVLSILAFGCSAEKPPVAPEVKTPPGVYAVKPEEEKSLAVSEAMIQSADDEIDLTGKVDFDPDHVTHVFPLVGGVTQQIFVNLGDVVHKGQPLAEVFSPDLAAAVSDLRKATTQLSLAQKTLERLHTLADAKIAAQKDVLQAESDAAQAKADYDRSLKNLEVLGGNAASTSAVYTLRAPIAGVVVERTALPGAQVRNDGSQNLFTIGSTSNVWVTLDLYPDQLTRVAVGDEVKITPSGESSAVITSKIKTISSVMDPSTFTAKARCEIPNTSDLFRPQMFVSAQVYHHLDSALYIPSTSVFYDGDGKSYVFKKIAAGQYKKTEVQVGKTHSDKVEITGGVIGGDFVVSNQALFLNEEVVGASK